MSNYAFCVAFSYTNSPARFFLTTLLNKLQQQYKIIKKLGDKQNYIRLSKRENANGTLGPMRGAPMKLKWQNANHTYMLTKGTNRKYNEKCYKDYELWQGQTRTRDKHELGTNTN